MNECYSNAVNSAEYCNANKNANLVRSYVRLQRDCINAASYCNNDIIYAVLCSAVTTDDLNCGISSRTKLQTAFVTKFPTQKREEKAVCMMVSLLAQWASSCSLRLNKCARPIIVALHNCETTRKRGKSWANCSGLFCRSCAWLCGYNADQQTSWVTVMQAEQYGVLLPEWSHRFGVLRGLVMLVLPFRQLCSSSQKPEGILSYWRSFPLFCFSFPDDEINWPAAFKPFSKAHLPTGAAACTHAFPQNILVFWLNTGCACELQPVDNTSYFDSDGKIDGKIQ